MTQSAAMPFESGLAAIQPDERIHFSATVGTVERARNILQLQDPRPSQDDRVMNKTD